eukprot:NODE_385_length_9550_cov_0.159877.p7 type:complete len:104 gc:universal NODE_385_length_9550_cov_0.159877:3723-4034(+)
MNIEMISTRFVIACAQLQVNSQSMIPLLSLVLAQISNNSYTFTGTGISEITTDLNYFTTVSTVSIINHRTIDTSAIQLPPTDCQKVVNPAIGSNIMQPEIMSL